MKKYSRVCARIDLDAIEYNMEMMKKNIAADTKIIAVLKTDAYGHGAVQIARLFESVEYIWGYAVATADEAVLLKEKGLKKPVLVLGCVFPEQWAEMIEKEVRMTCYSEEMAEGVSSLAFDMGKKAYLHIKIDTGMGRLGFSVCEESVDKIAGIAAMPCLVLEGMFTHFAKADETDKGYTDQQIKEYLWMKKALEERKICFPYCHCSNSAGIIDIKEANMDLVRADFYLRNVSVGRSEKRECPIKTCNGINQPCNLCKMDRGRNVR